MKNLVRSAFVALTISVFAIPASAAEYIAAPVNAQDTVVKKDTVVKEEAPMLLAQAEVTYAKVEVAEVPEAVAKAVASKYEGYAVEEAYKGCDNSYKLVIKKEDAKVTVYYSESGELVKEETAGAEATVLI